MKTWLITGASTGIGRGIAEAVLGHGDQAAVTARDPHNQSGDPAKAGEVIYQAVNQKNKPEVLVLGKGMIEAAEKTLDDRKAEIERWRVLSESTDYD